MHRLAEAEFPRLANLNGRATLLWNQGSADVERASLGKFKSDPQELLREWSRFQDWARGVAPDEGYVTNLALLGPPVPAPSQVFAIGLNYRDHASEAGYDTSGYPQVFTKFPSCLSGPFSPVEVTSPRLDWEVELVVVIGQTCSRVDEEAAWSKVAGLMVGQDLSARDVQLSGSAPQWSLGKSYRGYGPIGPWLTFLTDCAHPDDLILECELNGMKVQQERSSAMIWSVPELIARLSSVCELRAGDLLFTGTPAGIGNRRNPPLYLKPGDRLVSRIEGLGEMAQEFISVSQ